MILYDSYVSVDKNGSNQSISSSNTLITATNIVSDHNSDYDSSASSFTAPINGRYLITGTITITSLFSLASVKISLYKNGSVYKTLAYRTSGLTGTMNLPIVRMFEANAADVFTLSVDISGLLASLSIDGDINNTNWQFGYI
jgi:hypothetical protein